MNLMLKQLLIGKVDGKHEYLTPIDQREEALFDAFLIPNTVEPSRMKNSGVFFISGFRGTGKTSFLRWHAEQQAKEGSITDFVLFKTDLDESQRLHISQEVGISWTDVDAKNMEVSQDFKAAWLWFILHKIGLNIKQNIDIVDPITECFVNKAIRLLGLNDDSIFKKAVGFMPALEGANVRVRADIPFFETELGGDFKKDGTGGKTNFSALSKKVADLFTKVSLKRPIFLYFDELEAFYHTPEQHRRDQRLVRDLIFSISKANEIFRSGKNPIHVLAAVRSEVVGSMGSLGQEVDRLVHDKGFHIAWHHDKKSLDHPLIQIVRRKINASKKIYGNTDPADPIVSYFPKNINNESLETFILDRSFYKPRDIVWRLSLAQNLFPIETRFTVDVLLQTEITYSSKLWDEIRYELSATYSEDEVNIIEGMLSGKSATFDFEEIDRRLENATKYSKGAISLLNRRSSHDILSDLYRLGAIGNFFRAGPTGTDIRNRWAFRGDPTLLIEKRMAIHTSLEKRLSAVSTRRRGSRSGR